MYIWVACKSINIVLFLDAALYKVSFNINPHHS